MDKSPESASAQEYKRVTTRIEAWGEGIRVTYDMVGNRGGVTHLEWQGKFDGQDYPVQGMDTFLTNAYSLISDRSYRIEIKLDGTPAATTIVEVSPDQNTLSATTSERTGPDQRRETRAIYDRVR